MCGSVYCVTRALDLRRGHISVIATCATRAVNLRFVNLHFIAMFIASFQTPMCGSVYCVTRALDLRRCHISASSTYHPVAGRHSTAQISTSLIETPSQCFDRGFECVATSCATGCQSARIGRVKDIAKHVQNIRPLQPQSPWEPKCRVWSM